MIKIKKINNYNMQAVLKILFQVWLGFFFLIAKKVSLSDSHLSLS